MARKTILETGLGQLGMPPSLKVDADGRIGVMLLQSLTTFLQAVIRRVNALSLGDGQPGTRAGNVDAQYIGLISPSAADEQFSVPHGLERVPAGFLVVRQDKAGNVYTSNLGGWGPRQIFLRTSVGELTVRLLVF